MNFAPYYWTLVCAVLLVAAIIMTIWGWRHDR